jgi:hypothetical protein
MEADIFWKNNLHICWNSYYEPLLGRRPMMGAGAVASKAASSYNKASRSTINQFYTLKCRELLRVKS